MVQLFDMNYWEYSFEAFLNEEVLERDVAHDISHIRRVVGNAKRIGKLERASPEIIIPAAWLHDCVTVIKDSSTREFASRLAAEKAIRFLLTNGYPDIYIPEIQHAIEAHSFTAHIEPKTKEAMVVQDADRLDAIGAIGIARCFMFGGEMHKTMYSLEEPFPVHRELNETEYVLDHFYTKLVRLTKTMKTPSGHKEAIRRSEFLQVYLQHFADEIECPMPNEASG